MTPRLHEYLERIGYSGPLAPDLQTLRGVHRAHLLAIPYENLDIHLGRRLSLDQADIFHKLVTGRRGGWCYEMNSLLAWALRELGFQVHLLGGAVNRAQHGDSVLRTHLVLRVDLEQPYLADVGFGNAFLEPLPITEATFEQGYLSYRLERVADYWRFHNVSAGGPSFDFTLRSHTLEDFAAQCDALQTSPESGFVRATVCHRFTPDGIATLRGAVFTTQNAGGPSVRVVESQAEYAALLEGVFGLDVDSARLWALVEPRHREWMAQQARSGLA